MRSWLIEETWKKEIRTMEIPAALISATDAALRPYMAALT